MTMVFVIAKSITLLYLFLLVFLSGEATFSFCSANKSSGSILCIESEKQALLSFKQGILNDTHNELSSWGAEEEECCNWAGVACDNSTGHVKEIRLGRFYDILGPLKGKLSPSLLDLTHLSHLDLSSYDSGGAPIPKFIGSLPSLRYLVLDGANFGGMIPRELGNLSHLQQLSLGCDDVDSSCNLYSENLEWLSRLSSLEHLYMSSVNLSKASDHWLLAINKLPLLLDLSLGSCALSHIQHLSYVNFTSISSLDIWENNFNSLLPDWIFSLSNLSYLSLSHNNFIGPFPNASTRNLCNLDSLDLSGNNLSGKLTEAFVSLSVGCLSNTLKSLVLSQNLFSGPIPLSLEKFSVLEDLDISSNQLNGSFPKNLGSISNLRLLDISNNLLEGVVSEVHFANLRNLILLFASGNPLLSLTLSPDWISPFQHLDTLEVGSWNLGPQFPTWLRSLEGLTEIDLSNTGLVGTVPSWFWNLSVSFYYINLCNNQLYGELPPLLPTNRRSIMYLCSNNFSGTIPRNSFEVWELNLFNNSFSGDISEPLCHWKLDDRPHDQVVFSILDLGGNLLSGKIPNCWAKWTSLEVIDLGNNNLIGEIPNSVGSLKGLESLRLRNNSLSGEIPSFLQNCKMLKNLDLGLNKFAGSIPRWIGVSLSNLMFLSVRSNKLDGQIPQELCRLDRLQVLDAADNIFSGAIPSCFNNFSAMATKRHSSDPVDYSYYIDMFIENALLVIKGREEQHDKILSLVTSLDLSNNNLSGEIPKQITSLQGLITLNLSRNHLRGSIPDEIGNMGWMQSLDVSWNELSGKMTPSISNLNFLSYLNVSFNNLSGEIPLSTQLQSLNASGFVGNQLCGPPLPGDCGEGNKTTPTGVEDEEEDEEEYWFRLGMAVGFAVSFLGVISPLVFCGFYRRAYFWFFQEYLWYKVLDCYIKFKRMLTN